MSILNQSRNRASEIAQKLDKLMKFRTSIEIREFNDSTNKAISELHELRSDEFHPFLQFMLPAICPPYWEPVNARKYEQAKHYTIDINNPSQLPVLHNSGVIIQRNHAQELNGVSIYPSRLGRTMCYFLGGDAPNAIMAPTYINPTISLINHLPTV